MAVSLLVFSASLGSPEGFGNARAHLSTMRTSGNKDKSYREV